MYRPGCNAGVAETRNQNTAATSPVNCTQLVVPNTEKYTGDMTQYVKIRGDIVNQNDSSCMTTMSSEDNTRVAHTGQPNLPYTNTHNAYTQHTPHADSSNNNNVTPPGFNPVIDMTNLSRSILDDGSHFTTNTVHTIESHDMMPRRPPDNFVYANVTSHHLNQNTSVMDLHHQAQASPFVITGQLRINTNTLMNQEQEVLMKGEQELCQLNQEQLLRQSANEQQSAQQNHEQPLGDLNCTKQPNMECYRSSQNGQTSGIFLPPTIQDPQKRITNSHHPNTYSNSSTNQQHSATPNPFYQKSANNRYAPAFLTDTNCQNHKTPSSDNVSNTCYGPVISHYPTQTPQPSIETQIQWAAQRELSLQSHNRLTVDQNSNSHNLSNSIENHPPQTYALSQRLNNPLSGTQPAPMLVLVNPSPSFDNSQFLLNNGKQIVGGIGANNTDIIQSQGTTNSNSSPNLMHSKASTGSPHSAIPRLTKKVEQVKALVCGYPVSIVCGAPMVGKSTIVQQALSDFQIASGGQGSIHVTCKGLYTFGEILSKLVGCIQYINDVEPNRYNAAQCIYNCLLKNGFNGRLFIVFHKCENLREIDRMEFLNFLLTLYSVSNGYVRSVLTAYIQFPILHHSSICQTQISMMDDEDIRTFIRFYMESNLPDTEGYVQMIKRNNLCFPLAVQYIIGVYLLQSGSGIDAIPSADDLDRKIKKFPFLFLSKLLHHRVQEVPTWVSVAKRKWIALFCLSHNATSSEELLRQMVRSDGDDIGTESMEWNELMKTFAVVRVPGLNRLQFHPLLVYYFMMELDRRIALEGMWFDISCSKVVKFLCGILCLTDEMSQCAGYKSAVFQCVLPEWPTMKNILQMAIHCNKKTYKDFFKVAMVGANLMVKWSTVPSIQFFQSLYEYAGQAEGVDKQSYRRQAAILEGLMAHAIHVASGNSQKAGEGWDKTEGHFKSALRVLKEDRASFYLVQLYSFYGRALSYQGEYQLSLQYLSTGRDMLMSSQGLQEESEDHLSVSEGRIEDMRRRMDVNIAMPLIFTGRNNEAKAILANSLEEMKRTGLDHATLDFVYNLLGLATQRGCGDIQEALMYYKASLKERMDLEMFCPTQMVVPLNNIGMLYLQFGKAEQARSMLQKALDIQKKTNRWHKYYTALTLLHKSEVCMKSGDLHQALEDAIEAKKILDITCNKHDLRFHLQHHLAHIRMGLDQERQTLQARNISLSPGSLSQQQHNAGLGNDSELLRYLKSLANSQKVEHYFEKVVHLGEESKDDLSDNSNLYVLSALEHLVLLNLGKPALRDKYVQQIRQVLDSYPWMIREKSKPVNVMNKKMKDHLEFIQICLQMLEVNNTGLITDLDSNSLLGLVITNCFACKLSPRYFDRTAWVTRYCHSVVEQERRRRSVPIEVYPVVNRHSQTLLNHQASAQCQDPIDRAHATNDMSSQGALVCIPQEPNVLTRPTNCIQIEISVAPMQGVSAFGPRVHSSLASHVISPSHQEEHTPVTASQTTSAFRLEPQEESDLTSQRPHRPLDTPAVITQRTSIVVPKAACLVKQKTSTVASQENLPPKFNNSTIENLQSPIASKSTDEPHHNSTMKTTQKMQHPVASNEDLKVKTLFLPSKAKEETSDFNIHVTEGRSSSDTNSDLNRTYVHASDYLSNIPGMESYLNCGENRALPDLQRHWKSTCLTDISTYSSNSSIQNHQQTSQFADNNSTNPNATSHQFADNNSAINNQQMQGSNLNEGSVLLGHVRGQQKKATTTDTNANTDPNELFQNILRTYQQSQKSNTISNNGENLPKDFNYSQTKISMNIEKMVENEKCLNTHYSVDHRTRDVAQDRSSDHQNISNAAISNFNTTLTSAQSYHPGGARPKTRSIVNQSGNQRNISNLPGHATASSQLPTESTYHSGFTDTSSAHPDVQEVARRCVTESPNGIVVDLPIPTNHLPQRISPSDQYNPKHKNDHTQNTYTSNSTNNDLDLDTVGSRSHDINTPIFELLLPNNTPPPTDHNNTISTITMAVRTPEESEDVLDGSSGGAVENAARQPALRRNGSVQQESHEYSARQPALRRNGSVQQESHEYSARQAALRRNGSVQQESHEYSARQPALRRNGSVQQESHEYYYSSDSSPDQHIIFNRSTSSSGYDSGIILGMSGSNLHEGVRNLHLQNVGNAKRENSWNCNKDLIRENGNGGREVEDSGRALVYSNNDILVVGGLSPRDEPVEHDERDTGT